MNLEIKEEKNVIFNRIIIVKTAHNEEQNGSCYELPLLYLHQPLKLIRPFYLKLPKLAFKVTIFARASASFFFSPATTCSGAPFTKRSLDNFF